MQMIVYQIPQRLRFFGFLGSARFVFLEPELLEPVLKCSKRQTEQFC